eukprot:scaffold509649_cov33-Prasinocladus_malaysianus.AAC.1
MEKFIRKSRNGSDEVVNIPLLASPDAGMQDLQILEEVEILGDLQDQILDSDLALWDWDAPADTSLPVVSAELKSAR